MGEDHHSASEDADRAAPADSESGFPHSDDVAWADVTTGTPTTPLRAAEDACAPATIDVTDAVEEQPSFASAIKNAGSDGEMPEYFSVLLEGMDAWGDSNCPLDSRPDWFDEAKFRRGQKFANDYFFGLMLAEMLSLLFLFSFADGLQPLVYTGNSDTPYKAFKRYLSTLSRVRSWYAGDLWAPDSAARKNLRTVRAMHSAIRKRMNGTPAPASGDLTLDGRGGAMWNTLLGDVQKDFRSACPFGGTIFSRPRERRVFVSQADMAFTQFGFVGLMLARPGRFGAAGASEADLEGFAHLWRIVGYLLGIEDRYNLCAGSLADVRQRCEDLIRLCVRPNLREVSADWEHMSRCMVEGVGYYVAGLNFESALYYFTQVVEVESPRLYAAMTAWQRFMFYVMWFVMCYTLRLPGAMAFHNWLLRVSIKKAETASPQWLARLENRRYPYQDCKPTICTRL